jgi:hypothetical protein
VGGRLRADTALYDLSGRGEAEDVGADHPGPRDDLSRRLREQKARLAARPRPPRGDKQSLDARTRAQLEALGYVEPRGD